MTLNSDFQKLYVDGLIHLYELDASSLGAGILRFRAYFFSRLGECLFHGQKDYWCRLWQHWKVFDTGDQKVWNRNIVWQGQVFEPMALEVNGLEMRSDGKASAPTLSMANNINGIQNAVSATVCSLKTLLVQNLKSLPPIAKYLMLKTSQEVIQLHRMNQKSKSGTSSKNI
jgi:phage-related protein